MLVGSQYKLVCLAAALGLVLVSTGCSYALPMATPPSAERVRILAKSPQLLVIHVDIGHVVDYPVPADGRLTLGVPAYRRSYSVYLFNEVKVSDGADPLKSWTVTVSSNGKSIRTLSLLQRSRLATDSDGFRLLEVSN